MTREREEKRRGGRKKVSNAKRYRFSCPEGGYIVKDGVATAFKAGTFEFLFRAGDTDTEY